MGRLTEEMLRRWDADSDAGYEARSPFTIWWTDIVRASINGSKDETYTKCVQALDGALYDTRYALYDASRGPKALTGLIQAMELLQRCDIRLVPEDSNTLDLQDISQMRYICIYQLDLYLGPAAEPQDRSEWEHALNSWFSARSETIEEGLKVARLSVREIRELMAYEDDYYFDALDEIVWVINMLEWYKLDDPRRDLRVDLDGWRRRTAEYEMKLRPRLNHMRAAGLAAPDEWAPRRFWWRAAAGK